MSDDSTLSIGRVTDLLKEEFPELTMSKVRFLETQGLIRPSRSPTGHRKFDTTDIRRLRFILRRQRDHFLPLKVIKSQLARWEGGEEFEGEAPSAVTRGDVAEVDERMFEAHELARRAEITRDELRRLIEHGLVNAVERDGGARFGAGDAAIARQCGLLMRQGLEPRHLRTVRQAVARHVQLIGGLTVAMRRSRRPDVQLQAAEALNAGVEAMRRLNDLLFVAEVRAILDGD